MVKLLKLIVKHENVKYRSSKWNPSIFRGLEVFHNFFKLIFSATSLLINKNKKSFRNSLFILFRILIFTICDGHQSSPGFKKARHGAIWRKTRLRRYEIAHSVSVRRGSRRGALRLAISRHNERFL